MRAAILLRTGAVVAIAAAAAAPRAAAQLEVTHASFQGGAAVTATGGAFSLRGTAGVHEGAAGITGGVYAHDGGYWPGVCGGTIVEYGVGCPGSGGLVPHLAITGCPSTGDVERFAITNALGGSQVFLMFGVGQAAVPIGGGCLLNIAAPFPGVFGPVPLFGAGPGAGVLEFPVSVLPNAPQASTIGLSFTHQVFVVDPAGVLGFVGSNGVEVTLG